MIGVDPSVDPVVVVYVSPQLRCDLVPYHFYRHAPSHHVLDVVHRQIDNYRPDGLRRLLDDLSPDVVREPALTSHVIIGGSALSLSFTWRELADECARLSQRLGVPVVTDMLAVVEELQRAPGPVVAVHRLAGVGDQQIIDFCASAGVECVGVRSDPAPPARNAGSSLLAGAAQASQLVQQAIDEHPTAQTVLLLGGSWWVDPARAVAERRGRRLVNNLTAVMPQAPRGSAEPAPIFGPPVVAGPATTSRTQEKR